MKYTVKHKILGFEDISEVEIEKGDGITSILKGCAEECIQMSLINAVISSDGFDVPDGIATLLDINEDSNVSIYFVVVIAPDIRNSTINLGAPIVANEDNGTIAQAVISDEQGTISGLFGE